MFSVLKSRPLLITYYLHIFVGSDGKESDYNVGGPGSVSGLGRSPGEGNDKPLQYLCLEGYSPWDYKESDRTEQATHYIPYCVYAHHSLHIYACRAPPWLQPGLLSSHFSFCLEMSSFLFLNCWFYPKVIPRIFVFSFWFLHLVWSRPGLCGLLENAVFHSF